jgi:hypothetical protein
VGARGRAGLRAGWAPWGRGGVAVAQQLGVPVHTDRVWRTESGGRDDCPCKVWHFRYMHGAVVCG